jgi:enoyl-CoA hydratase/carnithine racemase
MAIRTDSFTTLEIERDGAVMRVWLNRPKKLNALNGTVLTEIERLFTELQSDFETRVVVLGGRGSSFSAGADRTDPPGSAGMSDRQQAGGRSPHDEDPVSRLPSDWCVGGCE